jgi:cytochrome bd-type quinol oxidase subunit 2
MGMTTVLNPLVSSENGVPFNAHNDFVRFFFEAGVLGLFCYLMYGLLISRWAIRQAREASAARWASAFAVAATWVALFFLTGGTPELSLQTAILYELYGMLALLAVPIAGSMSIPLPGAEHSSATGPPDP